MGQVLLLGVLIFSVLFLNASYESINPIAIVKPPASRVSNRKAWKPLLAGGLSDVVVETVFVGDLCVEDKGPFSRPVRWPSRTLPPFLCGQIPRRGPGKGETLFGSNWLNRNRKLERLADHAAVGETRLRCIDPEPYVGSRDVSVIVKLNRQFARTIVVRNSQFKQSGLRADELLSKNFSLLGDFAVGIVHRIFLLLSDSAVDGGGDESGQRSSE
jgi:hypothetical protein